MIIQKLWNDRYATIVKVFTIINIILFEVSIGIWVKSGLGDLFKWSDFSSLYNSFVKMRSEIGGQISSISLQAVYQHGILGGINLVDGRYALQYPPLIAFIYWPLSFLQFNAAFIIWVIIEVGLLIWLLFLLNQLFSEWSKNERLVFTIAILAFFPLAHTILTGQFSLFLLICLVQVYISLKKEKPIPAGIWMAFLLIKPQTVLIPGLLLLNRRFWRGAVSAVLTAIGLFVLSSLLFGLEPWIKYIQLLADMNINFGDYPFMAEAEYTLKGILTRILTTSQSSSVTLLSNVALLLGMAFVLYLWITSKPANHTRFNLFFAFTIAISVFLSLHLYTYDNLILVLPAALFYEYLRKMGHRKKAYSILALISPLVFFIDFFTTFSLFGILLLPTAITLSLLGWMLFYMVSDYQNRRINRATIITNS